MVSFLKEDLLAPVAALGYMIRNTLLFDRVEKDCGTSPSWDENSNHSWSRIVPEGTMPLEGGDDDGWRLYRDIRAA